ncbi:5-formyltetrahydrofolate cyclo-ligase [uncultured Nitrosomonas sp.]|uniref:5-formyltetrahydrofolate cyclo-ligase n=1 Tax=uncultured Nitrosomonas sp. TaxID=156424 RepID=UPI0025ECD733|nr:5-formyltetrahydrofolate cyclo-ligase [uncultured Nitrosomonas sp.]
MDELSEWKKQQRKQLISARESIPEKSHMEWSQAISSFLTQELPKPQKMIIGIYCPFRGEYDPRLITQYLTQHGATLALPEIIAKDKPLRFREWLPDTPMKNGAYGIPIPVGTKIVRLDAVIIPMVGFDQQGYRLGYGSGFFDRTLDSYQRQPLSIGVAFEIQRLDNIYPQPHDISMHYVVTEAGSFQTKSY